MVPAAAKATTVAMVPAAAKVTTMAEATTMALGPQNGRREPPLKLQTRRPSAAFPWMRTLH